MEPATVNRLTLILALVAAALAFAAVGLGYSTDGKISWTPLGGGLFMLALAGGIFLKGRKDQGSRGGG